jgi:GNAT superfamily N-acetyltransferase
MSQAAPTVVIRPVTRDDEPRWRELWDGYTRFYEREPVEEITRHTWARIMDEHAPVHAIVAETGGHVVGMANYLLHENTSTLAPVCYLQDLFVDPAARTHGIGGLLIDRLWELTREHGWARLYWQTRENNYRARALYDRYTPHSGFLRYVLRHPDAA